MSRSILASDFHLKAEDPAGLDLFDAFCGDVVAGAAAFYVLGDLFETWCGPSQLRDPAATRVFRTLSRLAAAGTEVVLFHGNRDFLLGEREARAAGGRVVGEELAVELHGRRLLLLHGDSLCTADVGYQRSKVWLRSAPVRWLSAVVPFAVARTIATGLRGTSKRTTSRKPRWIMELRPEAVRARIAEGHAALVCGHVHAPGRRDYGSADEPGVVHVLGDWHASGVYAEADAAGVRLRRYPEAAGDAPARGGSGGT